MQNTIKTTIDAAGRLVIPKSLREAAGLVAGAELTVSCRDGVVHIAPSPAEVRIERRGKLSVAEPIDDEAVLDRETVERTRDALRRRSS